MIYNIIDHDFRIKIVEINIIWTVEVQLDSTLLPTNHHTNPLLYLLHVCYQE